MARQVPLFEGEALPGPEREGLLLVSRPGRPLTKGQRTFNRLVAKVERLRAQLENTTREYDEALAYYGEHLHSREQREQALRKDLVRAAAPFLNSRQLKKGERQTLREILVDLLIGIGRHEGSLADLDLREIFERVHGVDFEDAEREVMEQTRSMMEAMFADFGIDVDLSGFQPAMSEADFAARAAQMGEEFEQKAEEAARAQPGRSKSRRELEREERERQAEEARKKSIGSIYKQLARVLHPDLEPDAERRQLKVALMQDLTAAYRNNDLHTLLRLQLEWIQKEEGDLDRMTDEKLAIYNHVLKEQVADLESQLAQLPLHPRYSPLTEPGDFGMRVRTDGPARARRLDETIAEIEESLARLRSSHALREIQEAIRVFRADQRAAARRMRFSMDDPF
jgi:hypothetical protein